MPDKDGKRSSTRRRLLMALRLIPLPILGAYIWHEQPWSLELETLPLWPLAVALVLNFGVYLPIKAFRWRVALDHPPAYFRILSAMMEGLLANMMFGLGSGDLVRAARLRPATGSFATDLGSSLAERATEYVALSILLFATWAVGTTGPIAAVLAGVFVFGFLAILVFGSHLVRLVSRWKRVAAGLQSALTATSPGKVAAMLFLSLAGWLVETVMLMFVLYAFALPHDLGTAALVLVGINAAIAIPAAPANLGTFEAGIVAVLSWRGVDTSQALAFALAYHMLLAVPTACLGALLFTFRSTGKGGR